MTPLYSHQKRIIDEDKKRTGLFLGTGSSKSRIALHMAQGKTLVICPKILKEDETWEREAMKWRIKTDITVISKETFRRDWESLPTFDTIIVDEAHTCLGVTPNTRQRNRQIIPKSSQLFEALVSFIKRTNPERIYLLTATIVRTPMTVWGAATVLGYTWNWYKFRETFYVKLPMPGREVWTPKTDSHTKDYLARIVRGIGYVGQLSDYFDVPEQTYKNVYIELTKHQSERLKSISLEYPDPLVLLGKKHQIENGTLSGNEFSEAEEFPNEKIDKILEYSIEFPRMIVFAKYTNQINNLAVALRKSGRKIFILDGSTPDKGRLLKEVRLSPEYVLICQSQISAGWELPECPVMIFASMSYSIVDRIQAEGRILRANALKKNLYITLITKGGVDEAVHKSIENKQDFIERTYLNL